MIRTVILLQGSGEDPIECVIIHTELNKQQYQALSYEWGVPNNDGLITIDACPVRIRRNLYEALVQIRSATEDLCLWIDALCINRANLQERNHQVGMMGKIYKGAENVIVWLGVARDDSDVAMKTLADTRLEDLIGSGSLEMMEQQALIKLCHRSYWRRAWILQELYLAQSYVLWCGPKFISEERFGTSLAIVNFFDSRYDYCKIITSSPANQHRQSKVFQNTSIGTMGRWLRVCVYFDLESAQPRDLIYAILAISTDCNNCQIVPDYGKPLLDVYLEALAVCNTPIYGLASREKLARRLAAMLGLTIDEELERHISKSIAITDGIPDGMDADA